MTFLSTPTLEQVAAIQEFRIEYSHPDRMERLGATSWKECLLVAWARGWDADRENGGSLRYLRNNYGPEWLESYEPPELQATVFKGRTGHELFFSGTGLLAGTGLPDAIHSSVSLAKKHAKKAGAKQINF